MVGGRLFCRALLLLLVYFHDVEATSTCEHLVHKKVKDTVELSSCHPSESVNFAEWKFEEDSIVRWDTHSGPAPVTLLQFKDRAKLNSKNFSLTVEDLSLQDSGKFIFLSEANRQQRGTITITLQVHELIPEGAVPAVTSRWHASNSSCTFWVECNRTSRYSSVGYSWTVGNQTYNGSRGHFSLKPEEGDTDVHCTVFNAVNEKSASKTVKCSNQTSPDGEETAKPLRSDVVIYAAAASGISLVLIVIVAVGVHHWKQRQAADTELHSNTIYADVSDVPMTNVRSNVLTTPCSIYETIDDRVNSVAVTGPQTVYDQIQFNRSQEVYQNNDQNQEVYQNNDQNSVDN